MMPGATRILVIDDNPAIHEDFHKIFRSLEERPAPSAAEVALFGDDVEERSVPSFCIESAFQGREGLEKLRAAIEQENPYALAFVDVRMPPGWDGVETVARLWQEDEDIQVVLCTAFSDYSWTEMLARLGRSDRLVILKKPFDNIEVLQLASALTEKWRLSRAARATVEDLERRVSERTREVVAAGKLLAASEAQYRMLFDQNPNPMWAYDLETLRIVTVNAAACEHYGYTRAEFLAMTIRDLRPPEDAPALDRHLAQRDVTGRNFGVWRHRKRDGTLIDVEVSSDRLMFDGRPARIILSHDVTEQRLAAAAVKRLNRVYALLSGINSLIVRVRDREELFREACRIAVEAGGMRMSFVVLKRGDAVVPLASAGKDEALIASINALLASPQGSRTMVARAMASREPIVSNDSLNDPALLLAEAYARAGVRSLAVLPLVVAGEAAGALVLYSNEKDFFHDDEMRLLHELTADISHAMDHIGKRELLDYLAYYDPLTGLANRALFLDRIGQNLRGATAPGRRVALFLLDLERFRIVNDSLGRAAGDAVLRQVALWLTQRCGDATLLGRVGPDHFGVLLPDVGPVEEPARVVAALLQDFSRQPFCADDASLRISAKAGVALYPEDARDAEGLFNHAEAALLKAKAAGHNYLFYTQAMSEAVAGRLGLESRLREALARGEFVLHYQPKTSLASGKLVGCEALLRWNDPRSGLVAPAAFIPVLEETGLIHDVGSWALRQAIADYLRWREAGLELVRIGVNVSPLQLRRPGFAAEIAQATAANAAAAGGLELEITESLIMEDVRLSAASLEAIRALGVTIAIDDFGTGFSSLSYLAKLPVDLLKIDRAFIIDMTTGPEGLALVSTIIKLAHALKIRVVAEGVETEEQKHLLRLLGCDEMQGFLLSKPLPRDEFEARFLLPAAAPAPALSAALAAGVPALRRI